MPPFFSYQCILVGKDTNKNSNYTPKEKIAKAAFAAFFIIYHFSFSEAPLRASFSIFNRRSSTEQMLSAKPVHLNDAKEIIFKLQS